MILLVYFLLLFLQPHAYAEDFSMKLTSPAFKEGAAIPRQHTCQGRDTSPELRWSDVPRNAATVALIVDDPDAPGGTWVHWVLFNLPAVIESLPGEIPGIKALANGELQGKNDSNKIGYGGPCPPSGMHRYFFKLYALDVKLNLAAGATKQELEKAMQGHILAQAQLMGTYQKTDS